MRCIHVKHDFWRKGISCGQWLDDSDIYKDFESKAKTNDLSPDSRGQGQGLEMSRSVAKIKANVDHRIYMHSENFRKQQQ